MSHHLFSRGALYESLAGETSTRLAHAALSYLPLSTYQSRGTTDTVHILDSACGPGIVTKLLLSPTPAYLSQERPLPLPLIPSPRITALDYSSDMIDTYNANAKTFNWDKVKAYVQDAQDLSNLFPPSPSPSPGGGGREEQVLDAAIMSLGIFGVQDAVACIREMHRVLKPGGHLILTTWKIRRPQELLAEVANAIRPPSSRAGGGGGGGGGVWDIDPKWLTSEHLVSVVRKAGFNEEEIMLKEFAPNWRLGSYKGVMEGLERIWDNRGWSVEEKGRWKEEVERLRTDEEKSTGTLSMVAHICVARKKD